MFCTCQKNAVLICQIKRLSNPRKGRYGKITERHRKFLVHFPNLKLLNWQVRSRMTRKNFNVPWSELGQLQPSYWPDSSINQSWGRAGTQGGMGGRSHPWQMLEAIQRPAMLQPSRQHSRSKHGDRRGVRFSEASRA